MIVTDDQFVLPPFDRGEVDVRRNQPAFRQKIIKWMRRGDRVRIPGVTVRVGK